jgi:dTDP-4-dehydrorhamnose reductase
MSGILVTGISGFIGGHVWSALAKRKDIIGVHGATGALPLKPECQLEIDLANTESLAEIVRSRKPHSIIHLAAVSRPNVARRHSLLAWKVNNASTRQMAKAAKEVDARVIFASTDQVFDGQNGNYSEEDKTNPVNVYGETKKAAENSILSTPNNSVVLRLNNTFGKTRYRGASFSEWIIGREQSGDPVTLFIDQHRSPIDVITVSRALIELAENDYNGILHLGCSNRISRATFGRMLLVHIGRDTSGILELNSSRTQLAEMMPLDTSFNVTRAIDVLETPIPNIMDSLELAYGPAKAKY